MGRVHAALGQHALSRSALDSALKTTETGELLYSTALTLRARALLAGKDASTSSSRPHWDIAAAKERLLEVMGRMAGGGEGLLERLLLHGIEDAASAAAPSLLMR